MRFVIAAQTLVPKTKSRFEAVLPSESLPGQRHVRAARSVGTPKNEQRLASGRWSQQGRDWVRDFRVPNGHCRTALQRMSKVCRVAGGMRSTATQRVGAGLGW